MMFTTNLKTRGCHYHNCIILTCNSTNFHFTLFLIQQKTRTIKALNLEIVWILYLKISFPNTQCPIWQTLDSCGLPCSFKYTQKKPHQTLNGKQEIQCQQDIIYYVQNEICREKVWQSIFSFLFFSISCYIQLVFCMKLGFK